MNNESISISYHAFEMWFRREFGGQPKDGAYYLFQVFMTESPGEIVNHYLELVGDEHFTPDTFLKASRMILGNS